MSITEHHDEVLAALLAASGHPDDAARRSYGDAIRQDRSDAERSELRKLRKERSSGQQAEESAGRLDMTGSG